MLWWVWGHPGGRALWEDMAGSSGCAGVGREARREYGGAGAQCGLWGSSLWPRLLWPLGVGKGGVGGSYQGRVLERTTVVQQLFAAEYPASRALEPCRNLT